jgi:hypothetical protein
MQRLRRGASERQSGQSERVTDRDPCDDTTVRERWDADAREFAATHLVRLAVGAGGWEALYTCPLSGQLWLEDYPRSEEHGGGPTRLRVVHETPTWYSPVRE